VSVEEIYQKLRSDKEFIKTLVDELSRSPEFVNKIAEALKPELTNIITEELKKVNENLTTLNNKVDSLNKTAEKLESNQGETNKRLENIEDLQKKTLNELADIKSLLLTDIKGTLNIMNNKLESIDKKQDKMVTQLRDINNALNNLAESIEYRARRFLANKLKNEYNANVVVRSFEIEDVVQFDIFADLGDKVILGEVKVRAVVKAVKQLEKAIEKLLEAKPEFKNKKIIPMIYTRRATEDLIEECNKRGIYLAIEDADLTPLKF